MFLNFVGSFGYRRRREQMDSFLHPLSTRKDSETTPLATFPTGIVGPLLSRDLAIGHLKIYWRRGELLCWCHESRVGSKRRSRK